MKIAILLFGHLRTFEFCARYLKQNLLDLYNCDVFIHTWDEIDSTTTSWDNKTIHDGQVTSLLLNKVHTLYKPKRIQIDHQSKSKDVVLKSLIGDGKRTSLNGMHFMFESMAKANQLMKTYAKQTKTKYDLIVVTRPDIAIFKPLPIIKTIDEAKMLGLHLNKTRFFAGLANDGNANVSLMCHRGCDMLFWGKEKAIDTFINGNINVPKKFAQSHFYNVVSVYVANEIALGNNPQLVSFTYGKDWKNIKFNNPILENKQNKCRILSWLKPKKEQTK